MKLSTFSLPVIYPSLAAVCFAETDYEKSLIGTWEYRQAAGESFDNEGERLKITRNKELQGVYFGLEREGEHGLFYTAVEMKDLKVERNGEVSFTVPERDLFVERPNSVQEAEQKKSRSAGFMWDELQMKGSLQGGKLTLYCTSRAGSCPEDVMIFQKGKWSERSK